MSHFFSSGCCLGTNSLGNHAFANASRMTARPLRRAPRASRTRLRAKPLLRTRLAKIALGLAMVYAVFSGERWVLEHSATSASELTVATRMADLVVGETTARTIPVSVEGGEWSVTGSRADEDQPAYNRP